MFLRYVGSLAAAAMLAAGAASAQTETPSGTAQNQRPPAAGQGQSQGVPTPREDRSRQPQMLEQVPATGGRGATQTDPNSPGSRPIGGDNRPTAPIRQQSGQPVEERQDQPRSAEPARDGGRDTITADQHTEIRRTLAEQQVRPVDHIDVNVAVGAQVPPRIALHPLPPRIVRLVPAYETYAYILLADGTILIVEPETHVIVQIIG